MQGKCRVRRQDKQLRKILSDLDDTEGQRKVYASIRPENQRSIRVTERIGMKADGRFIKHYNGDDIEHIIYSIDRD